MQASDCDSEHFSISDSYQMKEEVTAELRQDVLVEAFIWLVMRAMRISKRDLCTIMHRK